MPPSPPLATPLYKRIQGYFATYTWVGLGASANFTGVVSLPYFRCLLLRSVANLRDRLSLLPVSISEDRGSVPGVACALYQLHASVERLYCIPLHNRTALLCVYRAGAAGIYEKRCRRGVYGRTTDPGNELALRLRVGPPRDSKRDIHTHMHTYIHIRALNPRLVASR